MDGVIIACGIIGLACLGASFFLKEEKMAEKKDRKALEKEIKTVLSDDEAMKDLVSETKEKLKRNLEEEMFEQVAKAKDDLSESSNTKMIAFSEMSDQIFAKLEENHKEVIFLYDMLNEKSEALKDFATKIEGMKIDLANNERGHTKNNSEEETEKEAEETEGRRKKKAEKNEKRGRPSGGKKDGSEKKAKQIRKKEEEPSMNESILRLHREGKTVTEISKELRIGQGEVGLILGLYGDKH